MSIQSVLAHKVRSALTVLGVVFGVGAVVAMLSIGEGARQETMEQISVMGLHNIIVRAVSPDVQAEQGQDQQKVTNSEGLTTKDADAIAAECPFAEAVEATAERHKLAFYGGEHADVTVIGVTPSYERIYPAPLADGRFITATDLSEIANNCVLGSAAKRALFGFKQPLGEHVKLGDEWFTVIGVMMEKGQAAKSSGSVSGRPTGSPVARDQNLDVYVPVTTSQMEFGIEKDLVQTTVASSFGGTYSANQSKVQPEIDEITIKLRPDADANDAASIVTRILSRRHNNAQDFSVTVPEALLRQSQATERIFNIVMLAIAGISLLVGGIGIMNIMLASVLERTHEIGIRRALGATSRTVTSQFLSEAVILSMSGGLMGLALGYAMTRAISTYADWRTVVTPLSMVLAFGVSVATGIAFGYYPARQAARKDPIEALRYE
ncbi:MAG TPA: ABC transporter permease [Candidatus Kapabacteria bacterium]|nr:ABC transporter permease [Candidatus Kapabacteria bacterium]